MEFEKKNSKLKNRLVNKRPIFYGDDVQDAPRKNVLPRSIPLVDSSNSPFVDSSNSFKDELSKEIEDKFNFINKMSVYSGWSCCEGESNSFYHAYSVYIKASQV